MLSVAIRRRRVIRPTRPKRAAEDDATNGRTSWDRWTTLPIGTGPSITPPPSRSALLWERPLSALPEIADLIPAAGTRTGRPGPRPSSGGLGPRPAAPCNAGRPSWRPGPRPWPRRPRVRGCQPGRQGRLQPCGDDPTRPPADDPSEDFQAM